MFRVVRGSFQRGFGAQGGEEGIHQGHGGLEGWLDLEVFMLRTRQQSWGIGYTWVADQISNYMKDNGRAPGWLSYLGICLRLRS